jgi:CRISPR/Cas system-associated endonuclease Cas1
MDLSRIVVFCKSDYYRLQPYYPIPENGSRVDLKKGECERMSEPNEKLEVVASI